MSDSDNKYKLEIEKLLSKEKLVKATVDSFHIKTNEKVKNIVKTANKLLELQVSLSRCCEWLNELVDKNLVTSEDLDNDEDPKCIAEISGLLEEGVMLGNIFDSKLESIKNCVDNIEPLWESLENARQIIHDSISGMPTLDITRLSQRAKDYEIKTNNYSGKKRSSKPKPKKNSPKQPLNQDDDFQTNDNNDNSNNKPSIIVDVDDDDNNGEYHIDNHQSYGESVSKDDNESRKRSSEALSYGAFLDKHNIPVDNHNRKESKKMRQLDGSVENDDSNGEEEAPDDDKEEKDTTDIPVSVQRNSPNTSQSNNNDDDGGGVIDLT